MTYKVCTTCNCEKLLSEFRRDKSQRSGYQPRCKVCARAATAAGYDTNYSVRVRERTAIAFDKVKTLVDQYKRDHPCLLCGGGQHLLFGIPPQRPQ